MTAQFVFNIPQLHLARSLLKDGIPADLMPLVISRCGASETDWQAMRDAKLVNLRAGRFRLSDEGRQEYRRQAKGRCF